MIYSGNDVGDIKLSAVVLPLIYLSSEVIYSGVPPLSTNSYSKNHKKRIF